MNYRKQLEANILTEDEIIEISKKQLERGDYYREEDVESMLNDIEVRVSTICDNISLASSFEEIRTELRDLKDDLY